MIIHIIVLLLLTGEVFCKNVISAEGANANHERRDKHTANADTSNRRFLEDLDDTEWHISHLKDTDFARRSECVGDTFEDKVNKYRKALKNDAALVQYVSADPLPFNESDLLKTDTCLAPRRSIDFITTKQGAIDSLIRTKAAASTNAPQIEAQKMNRTETNESVTAQVDSATTVAGNSALPDADKVGNKTADKSRRASEYVFSSVEYYDDIIDFDDSICPDAVQVITLEIDQLRNYDIECESMLEWRSLIS